MISVSQAENYIWSALPSQTETVELAACVGRLLAEDVRADRDAPPFDRVCMDGVATSYQLIRPGTPLTLEGIQKAGEPQRKLTAQAIEVMTGAVLPMGCDTVIPYEHFQISDGKVFLDEKFQINLQQNIHHRGTDHQQNDLLIRQGTLVNSTHIGVMASSGITRASVIKRPRVAIISTGDELVSVEQVPLPHQIRSSNSHALSSELREQGVEAQIFHLTDDKEVLFSEIEQLLKEFDWLILSGGVSMGKFDFVPSVLADLGVQKVFHKVAQRPGKPMWFGRKEDKLVFGLPGNPVSCLVGLRRYILPLLGSKKSPQRATLAVDYLFKPPLTRFLPVTFHQDNSQFVPVNMSGSGDYTHLAQSLGFIELPADREKFCAGESFPFFAWGSL